MSGFPAQGAGVRTLADLLALRAATAADALAYRFLDEDDAPPATLTYAQLHAQAARVAAQLAARGVARGDRVLLLFPPGLPYICAYFGCILAGAVAVPAYPPTHRRHLRRLRAIVQDAGARHAFALPQDVQRIEAMAASAQDIGIATWLHYGELPADAGAFHAADMHAADIAFLQYTSGSTGDPKGVMVSHGNLLENLRLMGEAIGGSAQDVGVFWLPPYHDFGLIGGILYPLFQGHPAVLMAPVSFLGQPRRWLQAISDYRGTVSAAPDFAYALCARGRIDAAGLDLRSWRVAANGAEPIRADVLARFAERFAPAGFRPEAFVPGYGLAEATLAVTSVRRGAAHGAPRTLAVRKSQLLQGRVAQADGAQPADAQVLVSCGEVLPGHAVAIVDPHTLLPCAPDAVGEIWVHGPCVAAGYWGRDAASEATFRARMANGQATQYLRTGDLGFLHGGALYVSGRLKDLVILRGRNHYPQDIEWTVERSHPALRAGAGAAFAVEAGGAERLVVVQELEFRARPDVQEVAQAILRAVAAEHGVVDVHAVVLLRAGGIPKTSSGKIQRSECRRQFLAGELAVAGQWQREAAGAGEGAAEDAPATPVEEFLAQALKELLQVERVGLRDDFFALGGHSLLATQLVARIRARFGVELELKAVFEAPSLQGLARRIEEALAGDAAPRMPIVPVERGGELPLSFAQQRLWFLQQIEPENPFYNMTGAVRLAGRLDESALERALQRIVQRHEVLRTRFVSDGGQVHQVIEAERPLTIEREDFSGEADAWQRMLQQAQAEAARPFDLQRDHLLRVKLLRLGEDDHVAVVSMHHIVSDGWSMGVLIREVGALYAAYAKGEPEPLKVLPIQYADYASWQRQWLQGEELERQQAYWSEQLRGAPALLSLPTDRPRPAVQSHRGARHEVRLDAVLTQQLRALAGREQATLFMVLNAALAVLLSRYSGQDDISIGSPIANRRQAEVEPLIGFFVNTLVLRTKVQPGQSVIELLQQVRDTTLGAYAHQDLPFEQLVELMKPERSLAHSPLFQVMLVLQNAPRGELKLPGVVLSDVEIETVSAKFDLTLSVQEDSQQLRCGWEYNTDLFDAETIERMARHYERVLRAMANQPESPVGAIELLDPCETRRIVHSFNATRTSQDARITLVRLLEDQALRTPDAIALEYEGERLTYGALHARANQLARHLRRLGVGPDVLVGLCVQRGIAMVVGVLGILKAGGAYVPLDPGYPPQRLAVMVGDAKPRVVLTQDALQPAVQDVLRAAGHTADILSLDGQWSARIAREDDQPPQPRASAANLAYVMYTSGSTGRPKGVAMTAGALCNLMQWQLACLAVRTRPPLRVLQFASPSFDVSFQELFCALCRGDTLVLLPDDARRDLAHVGRLLRGGIGRAFLPNAVLQQLALLSAQEPATDVREGEEGCEILTAGEQLVVSEPLLRLLARLRTPLLCNQYGPTETHVVTEHVLPVAQHGAWPPAPPIGRPIANARIYVLDAQLRAQPLGVAGEVYIAGAALARGYWSKPDLTAERFLPDPHGEPGSRMYRTGDIGRWLPNGELEYLGRADDQVKVRGFRIELGEIEAVLSRQEGVADAVVVAREHGEGDKRLVAYVVGKGPLDAQQLTQVLAAQLPPYMVPSQVVVLDALPLTPNGKVDRKALPEPQVQGSAEYATPRTDVERELAQLWMQLLHVAQVGLHDNFFALGGHSLLATQAVARIRARFGVELELKAVFEAPSLQGLARRIEEALAGDAAPRAPIEPVARGAELPLSFAQQRLWFLQQIDPDNPFYNMTGAVRLAGRLDESAFGRALQRIVQRHEVLRTRFVSEGGQVQQVIEAERPLVIEREDWSGEADAWSRMLQQAKAEAARPFDLQREHLLRVKLLKLGEDDHVAVVSMHHIVSDGWSMGVLIREVGVLYAAYASGEPEPLKALPIQYADYASWQRAWLQGEELQRQQAYWSGQLKGAPALLSLPTDRARPAVQSYRGAIHEVRINDALTQQLRELAGREQATLFMVLNAAFAVLLARYSGQDDILIGSPIANRRQAEVEPLIGFFVNTLVLRTKVRPDDTVSHLLQQVRDTTLGAYAHQDLPFEQLVELMNPERSLAHSPLFQVMLVLQNAPRGELKLPGVVLSDVEIEAASAKFDLTLSVQEDSQQLRCGWEYNTDLFDAETIGRLAAHYERLLRAMVDKPESPVDSIELLDDSERGQLLESFNATRAPHDTQATLVRLLEEQALRTPDAIALACEGEQLTYGALHARANQLARHLQRLGIGPDQLVGLCMRRGIGMVIGVLGILKAGGAYVPMDPGYPAQRLAVMVGDARPRVVLTQDALQAFVQGVLEAEAHSVETLSLDAQWQTRIAPESCDTLQPQAGGANLAYVIYTSGSTGKPKGVGVSHASVVNFLHSMATQPGLSEQDTLLAVTSLSFDIAGLELYLPLARGARVVLAGQEATGDPKRLGDLLQAHGVTAMQATPATWRMLLEAGQHIPPTLKVLVGGEALPPQLAGQLVEHTGALWNLYGPTETTIWSAMKRIAREDQRITLGAPIANTRIYVLDEALRTQPLGVAGEVYIAGAGLARGYWSKPDLTAERFLPDPHGEAGSRMYRTGDIGRWLPNGELEYLGRADDQVKVRGFRIELGEIEAVLSRQDGVAEAVVVARDHGEGDKRLVAYVVGKGPLDAQQLTQALVVQLPPYMVPSQIVVLDALPLTPNGKLDRKALPAPGAPAGTEDIAPQTELQQHLAQLWQDVLHLDRVGLQDNFFALGGNSLSIVKLHSRIDAAYPGALSLIDLFKYPSVARQAASIGAGAQAADAADAAVDGRSRGQARRRNALAASRERRNAGVT